MNSAKTASLTVSSCIPDARMPDFITYQRYQRRNKMKSLQLKENAECRPQLRKSRVRFSGLQAAIILAALTLSSNGFLPKLSQFLISNNSVHFASTQQSLVNGSLLNDLADHPFSEHPYSTPGDARINGKKKNFPRICQDGPLLEPIWEWHHFGNRTGQRKDRRRLLIATYSAFGKYARLLDITAPINKAYAKLWSHDIVVVQGTTFVLPWDGNCTPPEERSRFNKIDLLLEAVNSRDRYDHLLLLDADALVYDFSFDITQLLTNETMLVAQRTKQDDPRETRNINNGITLWNLHHPLTPAVARDWSKACRDGIPDNRPHRGDQYYLRKVLNSDERIGHISTVWDEFYYRDGTLIKHFQRSNSRSWNGTGLDTREEKIMNVTMEICQQYDINATDLDFRSYTSVVGNLSTFKNSCIPRRKSDWDLIPYSKKNTTLASKRLLIAQYSSFGSYASLLEATAPINKAYARKWKHDFLIVQGTALLFDFDDPRCEPPQHRSMYNKIPLLIYALSRKDEYDQLLILDADTIMYDLAYDVISLLNDEDMLVAHRVNPNDTLRTWNINNGITLWNLNHNTTTAVAKQWLRRTSKGLSGAHHYRWKDHGDQYYLHMVLRHEKDAIRYTKALSNEFRYEKGTVARHYVRPRNNDWSGYGKDRREQKMQGTVEEICTNFPTDCENMEQIPYATK